MKKFRFFAGFLTAQEKWLNKMSQKGYRLTGTTIGSYEFTECEPGKYVYAAEYVGNKSAADSNAYKEFLEDLGYTVYYKNINLDFSVGKVEIRPWADKGGRIATDRGSHNKEIMLIEKEEDGKPFELHTTAADKAAYCYSMAKPSLFLALPFLIIGAVTGFWPLLLAGALLALPGIINLCRIAKLKKESSLEDQAFDERLVKRADLICLALILAGSIFLGVALGPGISVNINHGSTIGFIGSGTSRKWVGRYASMNGTFSHTLNIKDGTLDMSIETDSGTLDIIITDSEGNVLLDEKNVSTSSRSIPVEGKVRINLEAEKHSGSYSFE